MSLPQERSTAELVFYTWVARSRSGSSSFTVLLVYHYTVFCAGNQLELKGSRNADFAHKTPKFAKPSRHAAGSLWLHKRF